MRLPVFRHGFITSNAISKMESPKVQVFGSIRQNQFNIYLYRKTSRSAKWIAKNEIGRWDHALEYIESLVSMGVPRDKFEFIGTIFEPKGALYEAQSQFSIKKEEQP
jgi:hypothetical protein